MLSSQTEHAGRTLGLIVMAFGVVVGLAGWGPQTPNGDHSTDAIDTVSVSIEKGEVSLSPEAVAPGSTMFKVTNDASAPREVALTGPVKKDPDAQVKPGKTTTFAASLKAGTYTVYSPTNKEKTATKLTVEK